MILHSVIAVAVAKRRRLAGQASLTEEFIQPLECNDGFFALLGDPDSPLKPFDPRAYR
jgi:hypothetical protein